jgi:hypothetical protein
MTTPLRDDHDMKNTVRGWLREDDEPTMDRNRQVSRIMGRVDETKQRRRRWPLNPFGRRAVHSATGTDGAVAGGRSTKLAPMRLMTAVIVVTLVSISLLYMAARPPGPMPSPAALPVDPADEALFERMAGLWVGSESDLTVALEVYADDAVHTVLWQDDVERISGNFGIWSRMRRSEIVQQETKRRVRLPDTADGAHRYLVVTPGSGGIACAFWVEDERITRHDCILPMSQRDATPAFPVADSSAVPAREELAAVVSQGWAGDDNAMEQSISADIVHHVALDNHAYTLEGLDQYQSVATAGGPQVLAPAIDLPAPEGELRWTDFSDIAGGTLCIFWARDDQVIRHDCIVPTTMNSPSPGNTQG